MPKLTTQKLLPWIAIIALGTASLYINFPEYRINHPEYHPDSIILVGSGFEAFALAQSLLKNHTFSDPFLPLPTGPSAHMAPLYPACLALIIMVFGYGQGAVRALTATIALLFAIQVMLLPVLARRLRLGFWTGCLASLAWIAAGTQPTIASEATLAGVLVIIAVFLMRTSFTVELSTRPLLISGVVWGSLFLLQPVVILILLVWLLLLHFRSQCSRRQKIALGLLPILLMTPWIVRNFLVFHKPVFIRDNLGLELVVSNNPCASALFQVNQRTGCYSLLHPNVNYQEALKVRDLGEVEYNQVRLREAFRWIRANPSAFAALSAQRFEAFWFPPLSSESSTGALLYPWVLHVFTLASIAGLFVMWRNDHVSAYVVAPWLVLFPLIYYFMQFSVRFRYPILWATFLAGSYFIVQLAQGLLSGFTLLNGRKRRT